MKYLIAFLLLLSSTSYALTAEQMAALRAALPIKKAVPTPMPIPPPPPPMPIVDPVEPDLPPQPDPTPTDEPSLLKNTSPAASKKHGSKE